MSFADKVILITGASSGIGAGAARHLANLGACVAIVGRNATRLNAVADEIRNASAPVPLAIVADVNKDAERIIGETIKQFGRLNVLVNNAGILSPRCAIENLNMAEFDQTLNTNLRSVVELTKLAVPHLEKTKGNIVNVSSIAALRPRINASTYCISKAALDQFTKCAALELGAKGIRVNSVNPAMIKTQIFQVLGINASNAEEFYEKSKQSYPLKRVGEVSDTAAAIAYLAGESATFVTGVILKVDGGKMLSFTD